MIGDRAAITIHDETKPEVIVGIIIKTRDISVSRQYSNCRAISRFSNLPIPLSRWRCEFNPVTQARALQHLSAARGQLTFRDRAPLVTFDRINPLFWATLPCTHIHLLLKYILKSWRDG